LYTITKLFGVTGSKYPNGVGGVFLVAVLLGAILLAGLASGITAVVMERLAYRPLRKGGASRLGYLITAIGVSLFLSNLFLLLDGQSHLGLPFKWPSIGGRAPRIYPDVMALHPAFTTFGVLFNYHHVLVDTVAIAMLFLLALVVRRPRA